MLKLFKDWLALSFKIALVFYPYLVIIMLLTMLTIPDNTQEEVTKNVLKIHQKIAPKSTPKNTPEVPTLTPYIERVKSQKPKIV